MAIPNVTTQSLFELWAKANPFARGRQFRDPYGRIVDPNKLGLNPEVALAVGGFGSHVASPEAKNLHLDLYGLGGDQAIGITNRFNPNDLKDGYNLLLYDTNFSAFSKMATVGANRKILEQVSTIMGSRGHIVNMDADGNLMVDGKAVNLAELESDQYNWIGPLRTETVKDSVTGVETTYVAREFADNNEYSYGAIWTPKGGKRPGGSSTEAIFITPEYLQAVGTRVGTDPITGETIKSLDSTFSTGRLGVDKFDARQPNGLIGDTLRTQLRDLRTGQLNQNPFFFLTNEIANYFSEMLKQFFK